MLFYLIRSFLNLSSNCQLFFFFSSRRRHTISPGDWSSDVCSSDLPGRPDVVVVDGGWRGDRAVLQPAVQLVLRIPSMRRCRWPSTELDIAYHDNEWGVPVHDERVLFEFLILEGAQAGLSWSTILNKRENYRKAFAGFEPRKVARFTAAKK